MQIDAIELFHLVLPLRQPAEPDAGPCDTLETVLVRMRSGETVGWGEASPGNGPLACGEWAAGVFACLRDWMAPTLSGTMVESADDLTERLKPFRGNRHAKAALDTAWWDLRARLKNEPLHQVLDAARDAVEMGVSFDRMESHEAFFEAIGAAFEAGFARVELKVRPGWDLRMIEAVRKEFPTEPIHLDAEGGMGLEHMETLCRFDDFGLAMIEQPLPADDLVGHAMVGETIRTPIGLDQSITTPEQAALALDLKSCQWVNLSPGKVGGITPAVAIHDACRELGVGCWVDGGPQSAVGARFALALAAKKNCTYPAGFFASDRLLEQDLAEPLLPSRDPADGKMRTALWTEPGIGIEPDAELLEKNSLARATVQGT